jgi:demethylmenaquinone methyltransferase/2-methoxy-6-polyprenyl-1,4-benzoquinol methylase
VTAIEGFAGTYTRQATSYDSARGAGVETLEPLLAELEHLSPGSRVLDIGGGTGNYAVAMARRGYDVTVLDRSTDMLCVAALKGLRTALGDATSLPVEDASVDAVTMISMLHQVPDWHAVLREAQRVLEPGGTLVLLLYTAEHLRDHYFLDYFPTSRKWVVTDHASLAEYQNALPGSRALPLQIRGTDDLTMQIMRRHPQLALDENLARQTSYFARLEAEDPEGLAQGRAQLARDLAAKTLPADHTDDLPQGDATLLVWRKPAAE